MIVFEYFATRSDGVELWRSYSDEGYYIERDDVRYTEAVDPVDLGRIYTETADKIEEEEESAPPHGTDDDGEKKTDGAAE